MQRAQDDGDMDLGVASQVIDQMLDKRVQAAGARVFEQYTCDQDSIAVSDRAIDIHKAWGSTLCEALCAEQHDWGKSQEIAKEMWTERVRASPLPVKYPEFAQMRRDLARASWDSKMASHRSRPLVGGVRTE